MFMLLKIIFHRKKKKLKEKGKKINLARVTVFARLLLKLYV